MKITFKPKKDDLGVPGVECEGDVVEDVFSSLGLLDLNPENGLKEGVIPAKDISQIRHKITSLSLKRGSKAPITGIHDFKDRGGQGATVVTFDALNPKEVAESNPSLMVLMQLNVLLMRAQISGSDVEWS